MPRVLPAEIEEVILALVTNHESRLVASLACRAWRRHLFPQIFASITIYVEDGPWKDRGCSSLGNPALLAIAPHVRQLRLTAMNETEAPEDWEAQMVFLTDDIQMLKDVLSVFQSLSNFKVESLCFEASDDLLSIMSAVAPRLEHLELKHITGLNVREYPIDREIIYTLPASLSMATIDVSEAWPLRWLQHTSAVRSLRTLTFTWYENDTLSDFLNLPDCNVINLEIILAADEVVAYGLYQDVENSTVRNLTIRASHEYEAIIVSAIFANYMMPALTHVTLDFDLKTMWFPIREEDDWTIHGWREQGDGLHDYWPSLTRVDLIFRSCAPEMTAEAKEAFCKGLDFLAVCQANKILHITFLTE